MTDELFTGTVKFTIYHPVDIPVTGFYRTSVTTLARSSLAVHLAYRICDRARPE